MKTLHINLHQEIRAPQKKQEQSHGSEHVGPLDTSLVYGFS